MSSTQLLDTLLSAHPAVKGAAMALLGYVVWYSVLFVVRRVQLRGASKVSPDNNASNAQLADITTKLNTLITMLTPKPMPVHDMSKVTHLDANPVSLAAFGNGVTVSYPMKSYPMKGGAAIPDLRQVSCSEIKILRELSPEQKISMYSRGAGEYPRELEKTRL